MEVNYNKSLKIIFESLIWIFNYLPLKYQLLMYPSTDLSKPYFRFSFPKDEIRDNFVGEVRNIDKFHRMLEELWIADEELWKFKFSLIVTKNEGTSLIICAVKKCKFAIRLSKINNLYKISYFGNVHAHDFLEFSKAYQKVLEAYPRSGQYRIMKQSQLSYSVSKKGLQPCLFPGMQQLPPDKQSTKQRKKVELHLDDDEYKEHVIQEEDIRIVTDKSEVKKMKKHFYGTEEDPLIQRQKAMQQEKTKIIKDSYLKITTNRVIKKEEILEDDSQVLERKAIDPDQQDNPIRIFYASKAMHMNLRKWGKSIYVASIPYTPPKIPNYFIKRQYFYQLNCLVFMGVDQFMRITIFAIGISGGLSEFGNAQRNESSERILQQFFQFVRLNSVVIESIMVKENDGNLLQILKKLKKEDPETHKFIIKQHLNKRLVIHKNSVLNPGIIFKLAYCLVNDAIYEDKHQKFEPEELTNIMQKGRKIEPLLTKLSVALNPKVFGKLMNTFIMQHCNSDLHIQYFYQQFFAKKSEFCLLQIQTEGAIDKATNNLLVIDEQYSDDSLIIQNQIQENQEESIKNERPEVSHANFQENKKIFTSKSFSVNQKFSCKSEVNSKVYEPSQIPNNIKQKTSRFIGFNFLIDCQEWVRHLMLEKNLNQKMGESIVRDHQTDKKKELPRTSAELFFKELVLILNQNDATFEEIESEFWRNIGFASYGSSSQHHKGMSSTLRVIPKSVSFQTNWDLEKYTNFYEADQQTEAHKKIQENIRSKLPYYRISLIYLSQNVHKLILTYELMAMMEMNIYLIRPSERKKLAPFPQLQKNISESSTANFRTPMTAIGQKQLLEHALFIVGKQQIFEIVTKSKNGWKCTCNFIDFMGLPCRHMLKSFTLAQYCFADCISRFWKLDKKEGPKIKANI